MVGWFGLVSKLLDFTLDKLVGKKLELAMDDKRKAARVFLGMYHALRDLEVLSMEILSEIEVMIREDDPSVSAEWLRNVSLALEGRSELFLDSSYGIRDVLSVIDPALANAVAELEAGKSSFLIMASHGIEPEFEENMVTAVKYTYPKAGVDDFDLEAHYKWYAEHYPLSNSSPVNWPSWALHGFIQRDEVCEDRLVLRDPHSMQRFAALVQHQLRSLSATRDALGAFISERFTLEDLLAVGKVVSAYDPVHSTVRMSEATSIAPGRWRTGQGGIEDVPSV
ncbi:MAG TPA: hypothetical protein VK540_21230 [Polyangiaceae bacterium]|nr:hypothetical protein [Polyangiaceae bacterium]